MTAPPISLCAHSVGTGISNGSVRWLSPPSLIGLSHVIVMSICRPQIMTSSPSCTDVLGKRLAHSSFPLKLRIGFAAASAMMDSLKLSSIHSIASLSMLFFSVFSAS